MSSDEADDSIFEELRDVEIYWAQKCQLFETRGYALRPRYRPGWTPSWRGKPRIAIMYAEDALSLHVSMRHTYLSVVYINMSQARVNVIDATRISDGKLVYIKQIKSDSEELKLLQYLTSPEMLEDPHNHCVPLLDVIHDPSDPQTCFVVMPFLRYIDHPAFELVEDMLECGQQILEVGVTTSVMESVAHIESQGLVFLHDHGVAHRCVFVNA